MKAYDIQFHDGGSVTLFRAAMKNLGVETYVKDEGTTVIILENANPDWNMDAQFWRMVLFFIRHEGCLDLGNPRIRSRELR